MTMGSSSKARKVNCLGEHQSHRTPDERRSYVEALALAIREGRYVIDPEQIARSILLNMVCGFRPGRPPPSATESSLSSLNSLVPLFYSAATLQAAPRIRLPCHRLVDDATLHHKCHVFHLGDIRQWITGNSNNVRELSGLDRANVLGVSDQILPLVFS